MNFLKLKISLAQQILKFPYLPVWFIFLLDLLILGVAFSISMFMTLVFDFYDKIAIQNILWALVLFSSLSISMLVKKTYKGFVRYTDIFEIIKLISAFSIGILLFLFIYIVTSLFTNPDEIGVPWLWSVLSMTLSFTFLVMYRLMVKEIFSRVNLKKRIKVPVLIFGAGQSGNLVLQLLRNDQKVDYRVHGFLDDDTNKSGKYIFGVKIFNGDHNLENLIKEHGIIELIISALKISNTRKKEIFDICYKYGVKVKLVPAFNSWKDGQLNVKDLRNINLDELLGREPIQIDQQHLNASFQGKVILVTGAGGSIGSELARQLINYKVKKLILLDVAESPLYEIQQELLRSFASEIIVSVLADIKDLGLLRDVFAQYKPNIVFHAAAYKHVPMMETYPKLAIGTNVLGTQNLADVSVQFKVDKFIMVSTDKAVNPTNVMGATKRTAEIYVQSLFYQLKKNHQYTPQFITTRFGNVLGSNGSVIPLFVKQIENGGPVTVTHQDIERFFMTIPEACKLVTEAASMGNGGEIYVFDMGEPVKIYDLAKKMITLSGRVPDQDIEIEVTGLRMGEKLFEELIGNKEELLKTHHPKIQIVKSHYENHEMLCQHLIKFREELQNGAYEDALVLRLKQVVPEYKSNFSRFVILDNPQNKVGAGLQ